MTCAGGSCCILHVPTGRTERIGAERERCSSKSTVSFVTFFFFMSFIYLMYIFYALGLLLLATFTYLLRHAFSFAVVLTHLDGRLLAMWCRWCWRGVELAVVEQAKKMYMQLCCLLTWPLFTRISELSMLSRTPCVSTPIVFSYVRFQCFRSYFFFLSRQAEVG